MRGKEREGKRMEKNYQPFWLTDVLEIQRKVSCLGHWATFASSVSFFLDVFFLLSIQQRWQRARRRRLRHQAQHYILQGYFIKLFSLLYFPLFIRNLRSDPSSYFSYHPYKYKYMEHFVCECVCVRLVRS